VLEYVGLSVLDEASPECAKSDLDRTQKVELAVRGIREHLRAEMIDVESLTRAAEAAADALPTPATERQRLVFGRIQSLVTKTSQQASTSLRFANAQVAAFTAEMSATRSTTD